MNTVKKATEGKQEQQASLISFNSPLSGKIRGRAEVQTMLSMIDWELSKYESIEELHFRAGYLSGKIEEKKNAGFITPEDAQQLRKVLYAKYELFCRMGT